MSSGGGGLLSTMHDYHRFCLCMGNGGEIDGFRILGVRTVEWMASNHLPGGKEIPDMAPPALTPAGSSLAGYTELGSPGTGFGLGFSVKTRDAAGGQIGNVGEHAWGGAADTIFWLYPKEDMYVIWMTQVMGANRQKNNTRSLLGNLVYSTIVDRKPFVVASRM